MQRRNFVGFLVLPMVGLAGGSILAGCHSVAGSSSKEDPAFELKRDLTAFAFFQAFVEGSPGQKINTRGEGTKTGTISLAEIQADKAITRKFWHSHGATPHKFTVTPEHFADLKLGKVVYVATTVDDGHYHVVKLDPRS